MNFDFKKIYKKIFPSQKVYIASIAFLIIGFLFFIIEFILMVLFENDVKKIEKKYSNDKNKKNIVIEQKQENNPEINNNNEIKDKNENKEASVNIYNNNISEEKRNINSTKDNNNLVNKDETKKSKNYGKFFWIKVIIQIVISVIFILSNLWILITAVMRYWNINDKFRDLKK